MTRDTSFIKYNDVPLTVIGQHVAAAPETEWTPGDPADFEAEEIQAGGVDIIEMLLSFQVREIERMAGEFYRLPQMERSEG